MVPMASNFCPTLKLLLAIGKASENNFAGADLEFVHSKYLDQEKPLTTSNQGCGESKANFSSSSSSSTSSSSSS